MILAVDYYGRAFDLVYLTHMLKIMSSIVFRRINASIFAACTAPSLCCSSCMYLT